MKEIIERRIIDPDLAKRLELIYCYDENLGLDGYRSLYLEEWQYEAIIQLLGLSVKHIPNTNRIKVSQFTKEFVIERIKKMGVVVSPKEYEEIQMIKKKKSKKEK